MKNNPSLKWTDNAWIYDVDHDGICDTDME